MREVPEFDAQSSEFQFSLRSLLLATAVVAVAMGTGYHLGGVVTYFGLPIWAGLMGAAFAPRPIRAFFAWSALGVLMFCLLPLLLLPCMLLMTCGMSRP